MICDKCIHKEVCKLYDPKSKLVGCIFFQPVHKKGKWLPNEQMEFDYETQEWKPYIEDDRFHVCSVCNTVLLKTGLGNFCTDCGADMMEADNETDN